MTRVRRLLLTSSAVWVEVRLTQINGKWLASADTPDGPSLGYGRLPSEALVRALEPFDGLIDELMETLPDELYWATG